MSDTDSVVLPKPLPDHCVGVDLGQLKLEHKIMEGIFIKKKFYYIKNSNKQEIIKSSGIDSTRLNYESFIKLLEGKTINIERINFNVEWKGLNINVVSSDIIIPGLNKKIKTIYNTPDSNFKYISFPKKYNIIVHPLYPILVKLENKIKIDRKSTFTSKFSYFEIFTYFIFILSYLALISIFLYKLS